MGSLSPNCQYWFMLAIRLWLHLIETVLTSLRKLAKKSTEKKEKSLKMKRCRDGAPKYTHYTPVERNKVMNERMNVEKSHKSACVFPML